MFSGSHVALITPMLKDGQVDYPSLKRLLDYQLENGTDGLIIMGTTGEAATIPFAEQIDVLQYVLVHVQGRIQIIAGNGSNSTAEAVEKTKVLSALPIDGFLTVTPYYNKPTQQGMLAHFKAVAGATEKPVLLYNVPGRTGVDLLPATVAELSKVPNITGIKEATGSLTRLKELQALVGADFALLSGDDASACDFLLQGGHGVISVTTNIAPKAMAQMIKAARAGNTAAAQALDKTLQPLHRDLFIESNPIPSKWALLRLGLISSDFARLPLTQLEPIHQSVIEQALHAANLNL
ncbi:4-hydroxy-tetrahydrodipicolinate synthase [Rheinheimera tilapiae]|uniref:4-hydroxy-tetrahydrodipicolinate synthase n=1 Tax=Rheinheimera tilapiae TaxID=875043 RepID=A0ABV6BGK2_9GAMM